MVDLHTHILPKLDDGSSSVEESLEMLRLSRAQGVDVVVASPHFIARHESPEAFLKRRTRAWERLEQELTSDLPRIVLGAEVAYFDGLEHSEAMRELCLGQSDLLLVEMPFSPWSHRMVDAVSSLPSRLGVTPVLAHVERYLKQESRSKLIQAFMENGVYIQCNGEFFLSRWTRRTALSMLRRNEIHFLGSDCHNMSSRAPNLAEAAAVIRKKLGEEPLRQIESRSIRRLCLDRA